MNPIIELAFSTMNKDMGGGFSMDAAGFAAVKNALHAQIGKPGFEESIFDLWALAKYLDEQLASPSAASSIRDVVFSLKEPLSKLVASRPERAPAQLSRAVADLLALPRPSLPLQQHQQAPGTKWWQVKAS